MSRHRAAMRLTLAALLVSMLAYAQPSAAEEEPYPDFTVSGTLSLCGTFNLGTLTIQAGAALRVATAADGFVSIPSRSGDPAVSNCAAGAVGTLTINADRIINNGLIDGNGTQLTPLQPAPEPGSPAAGNGGGGHPGDGGDGSTGDGGDGYGDTTLDPVTEAGAPGGGALATRGRGGASIVLNVAQDLTSSGEIQANGTNGSSDSTGTCGQNDNPATEEDETILFVGNHAPGGGGAGGGIVLNARRLNLSGSVDAGGGNGGFGRAGGGGGGAGGVVKLIAPIHVLTGAFGVDVSGGGSGGACVTGEGSMPKPQGFPGVVGVRVDDARPVGTAFAPATFWNRGSVVIPVDAAGSYSGLTPSGFTVYICGVKSSTPGPAFPSGPNSAASPCGFGLAQLATKAFSTFSVTPGDANGFLNVPLAGAANDGYWAIWAVVVRGSGFTAAVSSLPAESQAEFAVDNTPPSVNITAPAAGFTVFYDRPVPSLDFATLDPVVFGDPSGLAAVECRNELPDVTAYTPCTSGDPFTLTLGVGPRRIGVRATDVAGNITERQVSGTILPAPTALEAEPAHLKATPKALNFFNLSARLIRTDTSQPLSGQLISMTVQRTGGPSVVICTGVTDANGVATCDGSSSTSKIATSKGYRAVFAGSTFYSAASDEAPMILNK